MRPSHSKRSLGEGNKEITGVQTGYDFFFFLFSFSFSFLHLTEEGGEVSHRKPEGHWQLPAGVSSVGIDIIDEMRGRAGKA
jgi:hypothetical protein